jgi:hypothetical protein
MNTSTQAIERYINTGGAVGDAEQAIARGNKVAVAGVQAGVGVASVGAGVAGSGAVATAVSSALTAVGTTVGVTAPVVGWVVAGVLLGASGAISFGTRRRAKFLAKDRGLLEKYIKQFSKKSSEWRNKEAKKQISQLQFILTRPKTTYNAKRQAKAELKLEALYFLIKQEKLPILLQQQQEQLMISQQLKQQKQILILVPLVLVGSFILGKFFKKSKVRRRK